MCENADRLVDCNSSMVENFLELGRGFAALTCGQVGLSGFLRLA